MLWCISPYIREIQAVAYIYDKNRTKYVLIPHSTFLEIKHVKF